MENLDFLRTAVKAAAAKKAFQLIALDVSEITSFTDVFLLCSGAHERHAGAIADGVGRALAKAGSKPLHVEGANGSGWVLMDYGDFVIHVFSEEKRSYYALDKLWADAARIDSLLLEDPDGKVPPPEA